MTIDTHNAPIRVLVALEQLFLRDAVVRLAVTEPDIEIVGTANSCAEALMAGISLRPDVVLVGANECMVPTCTILTQFRAQIPQTRVVILSAAHERERVLHPIRQGADGYLLTDGDVASVYEAIRQAAAGGRPLSPSLIPHLMTELAQPGASGATARTLPMTEERRKVQLLSARERDVMRLVTQGKSNREIARILSITEGTVKNHIHNALQKLELPSRLAAATFLAQQGGLDACISG